MRRVLVGLVMAAALVVPTGAAAQSPSVAPTPLLPTIPDVQPFADTVVADPVTGEPAYSVSVISGYEPSGDPDPATGLVPFIVLVMYTGIGQGVTFGPDQWVLLQRRMVVGSAPHDPGVGLGEGILPPGASVGGGLAFAIVPGEYPLTLVHVDAAGRSVFQLSWYASD